MPYVMLAPYIDKPALYFQSGVVPCQFNLCVLILMSKPMFEHKWWNSTLYIFLFKAVAPFSKVMQSITEYNFVQYRIVRGTIFISEKKLVLI